MLRHGQRDRVADRHRGGGAGGRRQADRVGARDGRPGTITTLATSESVDFGSSVIAITGSSKRLSIGSSATISGVSPLCDTIDRRCRPCAARPGRRAPRRRRAGTSRACRSMRTWTRSSRRRGPTCRRRDRRSCPLHVRDQLHRLDEVVSERRPPPHRAPVPRCGSPGVPARDGARWSRSKRHAGVLLSRSAPRPRRVAASMARRRAASRERARRVREPHRVGERGALGESHRECRAERVARADGVDGADAETPERATRRRAATATAPRSPSVTTTARGRARVACPPHRQRVVDACAGLPVSVARLDLVRHENVCQRDQFVGHRCRRCGIEQRAHASRPRALARTRSRRPSTSRAGASRPPLRRKRRRAATSVRRYVAVRLRRLHDRVLAVGARRRCSRRPCRDSDRPTRAAGRFPRASSASRKRRPNSSSPTRPIDG